MWMMRCDALGPPEQVLRLVEAPDTPPGDGEVTIAVEACSVGFVDDLLIRGGYQITPRLPYVPGTGVAGTVVASSDAASPPRPGARVVTLSPRPGGYASQVHAPAASCVPVPAEVATTLAVSALESYATARFALVERTEVEPGEWVAVLGAGSGVGLAAVDVARACGARVVAVASSDQKLEAARSRGAEATVDRTHGDVKAQLRAISGGGVDAVVDPVGGETTSAALRALAPNGRHLVVGFASGTIPQIPANRVLLSNRTVIGVDWGDEVRRRPERLVPMLREVLDGIDEGRYRPARPSQRPLTGAASALRELSAGQVTGKLVLLPDDGDQSNVGSSHQG